MKILARVRSYASPCIEFLAQDICYGLRILRKSPGFTIAAVLTLALGIGANTVIFSVVNAVLLQSLPFRNPGQLVSVVSTRLPGNVSDDTSYPDFADWRAQNHVFSQMTVYTPGDFTLTGQGHAMHVHGAAVSAGLFSLLGVKPVLGRAFLPDEDKVPATNGTFAIILSHRLWREHFGADPRIIDRIVQADNRDFTVVGVMPAGFQFPIQGQPVDFWMTMAVNFWAAPGMRAAAEQRGVRFLDVIARLKPHVGIPEAQSEMSTIVNRLNEQYSGFSPRGVIVLPEIDQITGSTRPALLILLAAVGCVLLIACANVASLMLARGASRQKEMAVRSALGASRGRLVRQLLAESVLLALLGGVLGVAVGLCGIPGLTSLLPADIPRLASIRIDNTVLLFTTLVAVLSGMLFGLAPAAQATTFDFPEYLREGGHGPSETLHRSRGRSLLVVADIATAVVLLVGAGLLISSLVHLEHIDPGFSSNDVLTFKIDLPYPQYSGARRTQFFQQAIERLSHLPGVRSASAVLPLPLDGDDFGASLAIEGQPIAKGNLSRTGYSWAEPNYFHTVGIPVITGRDFRTTDDLKTTPVVIINETLAKQFFAHQDPIGKQIELGADRRHQTAPMLEIVGVVGDVRQYGLAIVPGPEVYIPLAQRPLSSMNIVIRTDVAPLSMVGAVRKEMAEVDRGLPFYGVQTFDQYLAQGFAQPRLLAWLLGLFAVLALALAAVGLYGLVSYLATCRTHEIGIRMALGAQRGEILKLVVGQAIKLAFIGLASGIVVALGLTRFLSTMLFGVTATNPLTFVAVTIILVGVALAASYIPARRAMRVDPMVALRHG